MREISPTELKSILHSKRANIYLLEHCRVLVNGGRVEYVTEQGPDSLYWNIPIANTTTLLLSTGTSITQAAVRELAKAGVVIGFCGGGGSPLFAGTDVEWLSPMSEYRPTEYMQRWLKFWYDDSRRLRAAKAFQRIRLNKVLEEWSSRRRRDLRFGCDTEALASILRQSAQRIDDSLSLTDLLVEEARVTKLLYRMAVLATNYGEFTRAKQGGGSDPANRFLDHGNYLAYGLAATAAWVLGIPAGFAVLHGKTRRGGLVFDIADLVKDAVVLPQAFISAADGAEEREFRGACIDTLTRGEALDFMIDSLKQVSSEVSL